MKECDPARKSTIYLLLGKKWCEDQRGNGMRKYREN
jgi:hypothetical protein